jgi:hypothetical protein
MTAGEPDLAAMVAGMRVERVRKRSLIGVRDTGPARGLWHLFHTLRERLAMQRVRADAWMSLFQDDPARVEEGRRKNMACAVVSGNVDNVDGLVRVSLPEGEVAALELEGLPLDMPKSRLRKAALLRVLEMGREPAARAASTAPPEAGIRELYHSFPSAAEGGVRLRIEIPLLASRDYGAAPLASSEWEFVTAPAMPEPGAPIPSLAVEPSLGPVLGVQHAVKYLNAAIKVAQAEIGRAKATVEALLKAAK